jgi:UDP-glucose 4-epimerase
MDYLITGGAGFIGSNLAEYLVNQGKTVRIFDDFSVGKMENIDAFAGKIEVIKGDLRHLSAVRQAVDGVTAVIHLAGINRVPKSVEDPILTHDVNITGSLNVLVAARDAGVRRLVFSSSSSVYGDTPELPQHEGMTPLPLSPYATQKLAVEHYCRVFWLLYRLETISLRFFSVFGQRQEPQSQYAAVIPRFITAIMRDQSPVIFGDGKQTRDFSHVEDVIEASVLACQAPRGALGESFNIACGGRISVLDLVDTVNEILGKKIKPRFDPPRPGDILHSQADVSKAEKFLGWKPRMNFSEGIAKTVAWYQRQG